MMMDISIGQSCTKASVSAAVLAQLSSPSSYPPDAVHSDIVPGPVKYSCTKAHHIKRTTIPPLNFDPKAVNGAKTDHILFLQLIGKHNSFWTFFPFATGMLLTLNQDRQISLQKYFFHSYEFFASHNIHLISIHVHSSNARFLELHFASLAQYWKADDVIKDYCAYFAPDEICRWEEDRADTKVVIRDVPWNEEFKQSAFVKKREWMVLNEKYLGQLVSMNLLECGCQYRIRQIKRWGGRFRYDRSLWRVTFSDAFAAETFLELGKLNFFGYVGGAVERVMSKEKRLEAKRKEMKMVEEDAALLKGAGEKAEKAKKAGEVGKAEMGKAGEKAGEKATRPKAVRIFKAQGTASTAPTTNCNRFKVLNLEE